MPKLQKLSHQRHIIADSITARYILTSSWTCSLIGWFNVRQFHVLGSWKVVHQPNGASLYLNPVIDCSRVPTTGPQKSLNPSFILFVLPLHCFLKLFFMYTKLTCSMWFYGIEWSFKIVHEVLESPWVWYKFGMGTLTIVDSTKVLRPQNLFSRKSQRYEGRMSCYLDIWHLCFRHRHVLWLIDKIRWFQWPKQNTTFHKIFYITWSLVKK